MILGIFRSRNAGVQVQYINGQDLQHSARPQAMDHADRLPVLRTGMTEVVTTVQYLLRAEHHPGDSVRVPRVRTSRRACKEAMHSATVPAKTTTRHWQNCQGEKLESSRKRHEEL